MAALVLFSLHGQLQAPVCLAHCPMALCACVCLWQPLISKFNLPSVGRQRNAVVGHRARYVCRQVRIAPRSGDNAGCSKIIILGPYTCAAGDSQGDRVRERQGLAEVCFICIRPAPLPKKRRNLIESSCSERRESSSWWVHSTKGRQARLYKRCRVNRLFQGKLTTAGPRCFWASWAWRKTRPR